jgi:cysteine-rich repeat protein
MRRMLSLTVAALVGFSLAAGAGRAGLESDELTGCVSSSGKAKKFAFGDAPTKACHPTKETQVTLPALTGVCGDGSANLVEECDDGNTAAGDGCSAACVFESASCGDTVVQQGEQCDDGNVAAGDGCGATCQAEGNFVQVPFYVFLDGDATEAPLATNGPLSLIARCRVNNGGNDRLEFVISSTVDGWFEEDTGAAQTAGTEIVAHSDQAATGTVFYDNNIDDFSAVAPGGYYLGADSEITGLGLNLFGHNCLAVGVATLITAPPALP